LILRLRPSGGGGSPREIFAGFIVGFPLLLFLYLIL